ncbi:uncharacterized protein LOC656310 [Tribolium castaneum]|uniref:MICOS complex subunit MIC13 n=1 Tax=Tribolium castaneum TaxID=7070 RepID=D6WPB2_TRICA|nr:PREDICTED: uncharacterized protein LOC656310 [Tribolium castaneum]EFA07381.1 hypothetical protein TcasGA2_TC016358 [Tribolium castaneum]|eukprot:XP_976180.1 PREDICTED: uncharacterized protein LOC656310 [Tribolium castaneum]
MSKSRVCPDKTINAEKETCAKKTNLLIYEREKGEACKPPKTYIPPISSPQVKRIKICTGAELKKMCAPPPCPCPPKIPRPTLLQRLGKLLGLGAKSLVALGAVYVTYDMGIWGDSKTTGELYKNVCNAILPNIIEPAKEKPLTSSCKAELELFNAFEKDPYCCDKFPIDSESSAYEVQQKWNKIVTKTFSAIAGFPATVRNWSHQVYCKMVDAESCKVAQDDGEEECCPCD